LVNVFPARPEDDFEVDAADHLQPRVGRGDEHVRGDIEYIADEDFDHHRCTQGLVATGFRSCEFRRSDTIAISSPRASRADKIPILWACATDRAPRQPGPLLGRSRLPDLTVSPQCRLN